MAKKLLIFENTKLVLKIIFFLVAANSIWYCFRNAFQETTIFN